LITGRGRNKNFKGPTTPLGSKKSLFKLIAQDVDVEETLVCAIHRHLLEHIKKAIALTMGLHCGWKAVRR